MATRQEILLVLKEKCIPLLREIGFKGSFPNLYRERDGFISLINFQFFSSGGSFCVNLSYAGPNRENVYFRPDTELKKLTVSQTIDRIRLGAEDGDRWFSFGKTSYGEFRGKPQALSNIISTANDLIRTQAEPWWNLKRERFIAS
jgi:hypothetical protein